jgi:hypothetical protein
MTTYSVTVKAFGHVRTSNVAAATQKEAESHALVAVGFSVTSKKRVA